MPYPEELIRSMREELTVLGIREARTSEQVDSAVLNSKGTLLVVVNSVCGCAAGKARPGVALALRNQARPDDMITVFAGADIEATAKARGYFKGYLPSSPSIALLRGGNPLFVMERHQIEGREAPEIAKILTDAFNQHCNSITKEAISA